MNYEAATVITFVMSKPFEKALESVRKALRKHDLRTVAELDLSGAIKRDLGMGLPPFCVLCVDCPFLLLEATAFDRSGAVFLPLHVVVAASGEYTLIHLPSAGALQREAPVPAREALAALQSRLVAAVGEIAARQETIQAVT